MAYTAGWLDAQIKQRLRLMRVSPEIWLPVIQHGSDVSRREKCVELSIDDGPSPDTTPQVIRLLKRHDTKATFFLNGVRAERHMKLVEDLLNAGHNIYGHGYTHRRLDCMSLNEIHDEMERTEAVLRKLRPTPTDYLVRLPHGAGAHDPHVHQGLREWMPTCRIAQWNVSLEDWIISAKCDTWEAVEFECAKATTTLLADHSLPGSILLLHEKPIGVQGRYVAEVSVMLLDKVLQALAKDGYSVTYVALPQK
jgi:peptidoglycan/xylan/chitin deacetylase (PgdA/CDA1 family)